VTGFSYVFTNIILREIKIAPSKSPPIHYSLSPYHLNRSLSLKRNR
jgi:hypothetical protein